MCNSPPGAGGGTAERTKARTSSLFSSIAAASALPRSLPEFPSFPSETGRQGKLKTMRSKDDQRRGAARRRRASVVDALSRGRAHPNHRTRAGAPRGPVLDVDAVNDAHSPRSASATEKDKSPSPTVRTRQPPYSCPKSGPGLSSTTLGQLSGRGRRQRPAGRAVLADPVRADRAAI